MLGAARKNPASVNVEERRCIFTEVPRIAERIRGLSNRRIVMA
jgi:hypothetical protein